MTLQKALLLLVALVLLAGLVPAGLLMDRRLESALEARASEDLDMAPRVVEDRQRMQADARMMHAMDAAGAEGLAEALGRGDTAEAGRLVRSAVTRPEEQPLLVDAGGRPLVGPPVPRDDLDRARGGSTPVSLTEASGQLRSLALTRVRAGDETVGFAGVWSAVDQGEAATLAALTRSDVVISTGRGRVVAFTGDSARAAAMADVSSTAEEEAGAGTPAADDVEGGGAVKEVRWRDRRYLVASTPWGPARVTFVRSLEEELAVLPRLRRIGGVSLALALLFGAAVGAVFASGIGRPVRALADAAGRVAEGDFDAPVPDSSIREVRRVSDAFRVMRRALAARLSQLEEANEELEDRQQRLKSLQAELIQRDRLVASGRLVAELAHEIRNPVANVRNCLEVIDRRLEDDPEGRRFADMAIDELLRMHELAEQLLDLNRPAEPDSRVCDAAEIARQAAALFRAGRTGGTWTVEVRGAERAPARIPPDALKQVLMNLVENAREAMSEGGAVRIEVAAGPGSDGEEGEGVAILDVMDEGPGVPEEIRPRIFDPFFTTKGQVRGVGLGLSVAEGIVRRHGGRISVEDAPPEWGGARFRIELLAAASSLEGGPAAGGGAEGDDPEGGDAAGGSA